ncbi:hypothetical protein M406DRAFT_354316 [Cryphonectria parasitica EP155]|uniref:Uncharacterized protein n=1 Tax=Cryphonectria parasitica (strain ATCC 38755 / EP155) TaxID=660469 RepID=A0A9P5CU70_CRYP1|nr:uncharacterized protein M406DRAFT_354316 [Cryphonectria parasitica EP155]KAF3770181.1 hypothetical protein M406DRAFT_354316 [Cryphonectria parasitica EP155]
MVKEKKSRSHVGYTTGRPFEEGVDNEHDCYHDFYGRKRVCDKMIWMIDKGETITAETNKRRSIYWTSEEGDDRTYTLELYESTADSEPEFQTHKSVIQVGTVISDLSNVDYNVFENKIGKNGKRTYKVDFELMTIVEDQLGYMHFRVVVQGKVVGQARLSIEKESEKQDQLSDFLTNLSLQQNGSRK